MKGAKYECRNWCVTRAIKIKANYKTEDEGYKYCRECYALWDSKEIFCPCCRRKLCCKARSLVKKKKYIE